MFRPGNPCIIRMAGNKICFRADDGLRFPSCHVRALMARWEIVEFNGVPSVAGFDLKNVIPIKESTLTVALIGNPNTGKSTLFGGLVGIHQHVGNYPGVTVEKKTGRMEHDGHTSSWSICQVFTVLRPDHATKWWRSKCFCSGSRTSALVDAVLCIVDGSNLERHLYLVSQVLELGLPTVVAVNMLDVAASRGIKLEFRHLQSRLDIAVVPIQANRGIGLDELKSALIEALRRGPRPRCHYFPQCSKKRSAVCKFIWPPRVAMRHRAGGRECPPRCRPPQATVAAACESHRVRFCRRR